MNEDEILKQLVLDELHWDPKVDQSNIGVTTTNGAVTLSGHVSSYASQFAATDAVKRVRGVKAISDEIEVNLPVEQRHDDTDIAEHIARVISWNQSIDGGNVKATVRNGFVTLSGEVEFRHQSQQIEEQLRHVGSVTGIANHIAINPTGPTDDVKKRIEEALNRSASVAAENVVVSFSGDKVTLNGTVKALYERDLAERAAWNVPGVSFVENHIIIV